MFFSQARDIFRQLCTNETHSIEYRRDQWRLRFVRHPSNTDPLYWDERGFTWGLLFPIPEPSVQSLSEDIEDEDIENEGSDMDDEMVEDDPDFQLPEEDRLRLIDLRRRQDESEAQAQKVWKDLEDFHGWTDRGREAYGIAH